jgi:CubicO group peptidase (beta-lactamase class C family)
MKDKTMTSALRFAVLFAAVSSTSYAWAQGSSTTLPQTTEQVYLGKLIFSDAEEKVYQDRLAKSAMALSTNPADAYDPQETIVGAKNWKALPQAAVKQRTISDAALKAAIDYAGANNSDSFIVWRKGKVETEAYFDGHKREDVIISRSLAKPVTAAAVARAIMLGNIKSLDQPVADFVTEWRGDARRSKILIRHLLDMRTGFLPQANAPDPMDILNRAYQHPRHDEIIVKEYPVVDEPGTRYEYNNATSEMVAILIERATGRRYAEFVGTEIWQKLSAMGGSVWVNRAGGMAHSGCCMMVPSENFLRLGILFLQDGVWEGKRLLPEGYVKEMTTATKENPHAGMGVYIAGKYVRGRGAANPDRQTAKTLHSEPYLADDLFLFDGNANQVVYIVPSQQLVILRTGNNPPKTKDREWDNAFLPNTVIKGIVKDKGISKPQS